MQKTESEADKFNAKNVTKYWRNQKPPEKTTPKFIDPYFMPKENSLLGLDDSGKYIDQINAPQLNKVRLENTISDLYNEALAIE